MKKLLLLTSLFAFSFLSCNKSETDSDTTETVSNSRTCGFHNGNQLYKGPQGGCYYINSNGNKTYVDRSKCNC